MNRLLIWALVPLVALGAGLLVYRQTRLAPPTSAVAPPPATQPLQPPPPFEVAAREFFTLWQTAQYGPLYQLLTDNMRALITEAELITQLSETRPTAFEVLTSTRAGDAAFVIMSVEVPPATSTATPVSGYSVLLRQVNDQWRIALLVAEEKVADKYGNLNLKPATEPGTAGFIITFTDEQGQISTLNLQEP